MLLSSKPIKEYFLYYFFIWCFDCEEETSMCKRKKIGAGLLDKINNKTPFELHIPGYQYCGPGTKLEKRLKRGDPGINGLDRACKEHDIAYSKYSSGIGRYEADKKLSHEAWNRTISKDASLGERAAALGVAATMRAKMGLSKSGGRIKKLKGKCFKSLVGIINKSLKRKKKLTKASILAAVKLAKKIKKQHGIERPRVIPVPKTGGVLPLIPIFAGLSALGSITGGLANVIKTINETRRAKDALLNNNRLNAISIGKKGSGLHLKPYKQGLGLYLLPYSKNS